MLLGACFGDQECLCREFKEFCLKVNVYDYYPEWTVDAIVADPTYQLTNHFNEMMYDNLRRYIFEYIPKYASAFSTCQLDEGQRGELIIGISDFGEITGIPLYDATLNCSKIEAFVKEALHIFTRAVNVPAAMYTDNVAVAVETLDVDMAYLYDNTKEVLKIASIRQGEYNKTYREYLRDRDEYLKQLACYTCKLSLVVNDNREEFEKYIREHADRTVSVEIPDKIGIITFAMLEERRADPTHFIYYLLKFKDEAVSTLFRNKPRPPLIPRCLNASLALITHLSDLRHCFITRNEGKMNYFVIKVSFSGNRVPNGYLQYKRHLFDTWDVRRRVCDPDASYGPCLESVCDL